MDLKLNLLDLHLVEDLRLGSELELRRFLLRSQLLLLVKLVQCFIDSTALELLLLFLAWLDLLDMSLVWHI